METGLGKINLVESVSPKQVHFRTQRGKGTHGISRERVRAAIAFFLYRQTTMRKSLEQFNKFSSFLMGLLRIMFVEIARIRKTAKGLRLSLRGTRFTPAGFDRDVRGLELVKELGGSVVLCSYFHLRDDKYERFRMHAIRNGLKILLDSGAFSLHMAKEAGKEAAPIYVRDFIRFVKRIKDVLYGCINLDVMGDPVRTLIHQRIMDRYGIKSIPVWHAQSSMDELQQIVVGYESEVDFICIGGMAKMSEKEQERVLTGVFKAHPGLNVHVLGVSNPVILRFPVFSCDSTTPIWSRQKRFVLTERGQVAADKVDPSWDGEACMAYNLQWLFRLEEAYHGINVQLPLLP
ncbi:hypothetical protein J2T17_004447 [Paenibacillus mucilaginosus]|uniref:hypothetical protein n=1 Tax=Paenibacillus mucilaginosus TaxID=61624 RepID=UPI003D21F2F7